MGPYCLIAFATTFNVLSLLLIAISFATDHWIVTTVNRGQLKIIGQNNPVLNMSLYANPNYFSRNRGMFRTCYEGNETKFLDKMDQDKVADQSCIIEDGYELSKNEETLDWKTDGDYDIRIHLMRTHFAFYVLSLAFLLVAVFCGGFGCWQNATVGLRSASFTSFTGVFSGAAGIAVFHGVKYLEENKLNFPPFPFYWENDSHLADNSNMELGYSYILGWLGVACAITCAVLYLWSAMQLKDKKTQDEKHAEDSVIKEDIDQIQYVQQAPMVIPMMQPVQPMQQMQPVAVPYAQSAYAGSVYGGEGYAQSVAYGY